MRTTSFKASEIGPIPADWEVKRLGEVCTITTGSKDVNEGCENGRYPFFTCSRNVFASNGYSFDCEAILVAGNGDVGNLHYFNGKFEAYQRTYVLYGFSENIKYIFHELAHDLMSCLNDGKIGSSIPYITINQLNDFKFPLPPPNEQCRILAALSDADAWIESLDKLIEKKKLVKQGTMQALLSGKTRLPGFSGEWEEKRLGEIGKSIRGVSFRPDQASESPMPNATLLLRANNIQDSSIIFEDVVYVLNECIADCQKMEDGDILICSANGSRNLVGKAAIWKQNAQASFGAFMAVFRCDTSVDASFVGYLFQSARYRRQLDDILTGSAINNLNAKDIEGLIFQLPPLSEQRAIAEVLSDMDAELAALSREKAKAEQIKQGMMQELLTGKIRLKGE